jgi:hypothetical protein
LAARQQSDGRSTEGERYIYQYVWAQGRIPGSSSRSRGKIAIEIEYAEIWFKPIEVKAI